MVLPRIEQLIEERRLPAPAVRRALRVAAGFSLQEIADVLDVSKQAVHKWETGVRLPRPANRRRYARLLAACGKALTDE